MKKPTLPSETTMTTNSAVSFEDVDIRLAVGEPVGEQAIKITCPPHIHAERLNGKEDDTNSMAVYRANVHCFGCGFHLYRRYSSLAFLLGMWDGRGDEKGPEVTQIIKQLYDRLREYTNENHVIPTAFEPPPISPFDVRAFHRFLVKHRTHRMIDELMVKRGFTLDTIEEFELGHTGTHF